MLSQKEANQILEHCWSTGNLRGLLYPHQWKMYDLFYGQDAMTTVFHCSRRIGKTVVDLCLQLEACLEKDGTICRFASATQKSVEEIIKPIVATLTRTCPEALRPVWHSSGRFLFPHRPSSQLVVAGMDLYADRLRGPASHRVAIDEGGFVKELNSVILDVIMPQFLTTDGRLILSSSSPKTPDHAFTRRIHQAQEENAYIKMTIHEDSRPDVLAKIPEFMKEAGGEDSTTWRREYLCEIIADENFTLIPEFSKPEIKAKVILRSERPPFLVPLTVMDLGYVDNVGAVFGYVDFQRGKRVVLEELLLNRKNSKQIVEAVRAMESRLWGYKPELLPRIRRYADGQPLTIADFNEVHDLSVSKVSETSVEAKVNQVRLDVVSGTLQIAPECSQLLREIEYGLWDDHHKKFARTDGFGHYDLLSALTYFCQHANLHENPYPELYGIDPSRQMMSARYVNPNKIRETDALKQALQLDRW